MSARFLVADVFDGIASLPDKSIDLVMTSSPFLAVRSYLPQDHPDKAKEIGSEPTPEAFIDTLLDVVEALDRVLAPHGSIVFELGDTYAGGGGENHLYERLNPYPGLGGSPEATSLPAPRRQRDSWPLDKSLSMIPQSFAWALAYGRNPFNGRTTDRWRVRNIVVWARPNPAVGALGDKFRPATSYLTVACKGRDRYFDLDACREPYKGNHKIGEAIGGKGADYGDDVRSSWTNRADVFREDRGGAPPLDYWVIPTFPSMPARTVHRVRVPADAVCDGIQRTTSPDCPVHGLPDHQDSSALDDEHAAGSPSRNECSGSHRVQVPVPDSLPMFEIPDRTAEVVDPDDPVATAHSTPSHKTVRAYATNPAGTPSAQNTPRTDDTQGGPELSEPDANTLGSSSALVDSDVRSLSQKSAHIADIPVLPADSACTCSYHVDISIAQSSGDYAPIPPRRTGGRYTDTTKGGARRDPLRGDRGGSEFETHELGAPPLDYWVIPTFGFPGSHYATFPPALCVKPILAMCPQRVCRICGQPSRRIVSEPEYVSDGRLVEPHIWASGIGDGEGAHSKKQDGNTTRVNETLGWSDCGCRCLECVACLETLDFSADDHCIGKWRPGMVLDPFAGSGTTLAVATGHGRDAIGIDIDERNAELALERVGPLLLTVEHLSREGVA